jgi:hypothetical protein
LEDTVRAIVYSIIDRRTNANRRAIRLYWTSSCNDGYYNLTITPEQIFFSSSHENPNPNYLFWVVNIDSSQYQEVNYGIRNKPPIGFENLSKYYWQSLTVLYDQKFTDTFTIPDEWTDHIIERHDTYCKSQINRQLDRYISIINSYISDKTKKVSIPVVEMKPKYFSYNIDEIVSWMQNR